MIAAWHWELKAKWESYNKHWGSSNQIIGPQTPFFPFCINGQKLPAGSQDQWPPSCNFWGENTPPGEHCLFLRGVQSRRCRGEGWPRPRGTGCRNPGLCRAVPPAPAAWRTSAPLPPHMPPAAAQNLHTVYSILSHGKKSFYHWTESMQAFITPDSTLCPPLISAGLAAVPQSTAVAWLFSEAK